MYKKSGTAVADIWRALEQPEYLLHMTLVTRAHLNFTTTAVF